MNNLYQYIESGRIVKAYRKHLHLLKEFTEYQHFLTRMSAIDGSKLDKDVFEVKIKELRSVLSMDPKEVFELALEEDTHGYLAELAETADDDIYNYLYVCRVMDDFGILLRNGLHDVISQFEDDLDRILLPDTVNMMCRISKNEKLRELEGTICVNGLGYLLPWIDRWDDAHKTKLTESFVELYRYYLEKVAEFGFKNRNFVYGLTHCIINLSNFYTKSVYYADIFNDDICELYMPTADLIREQIKTAAENNKLKKISSDMLAELLVTYKLLLDKNHTEARQDYSYVTNLAYQTLVRRIDKKKNYIRDHKSKTKSEDLRLNEHTNILFILYSRL